MNRIMMNLRDWIFPFFMVATFHIHVPTSGMDTNNQILIPDAIKHIFDTCDMSQDKVIIDWVKWRQVSSAWLTTLTHRYIAKRVGFVGNVKYNYQLVQQLVEAIRKQKKGMTGLICRLSPNIVSYKGPLEEALCSAAITDKACWLQLLLNLGVNPNTAALSVPDENNDPNTTVVSETMYPIYEWIINGSKNKWSEQQINTCLDVLLAHRFFTWMPGLLEDAAAHSTLYVVSKLLTQPLSRGIHMTDVLDKVCERFMDHEALVPVVEKLLQLGAVPGASLRTRAAQSSNEKLCAIFAKANSGDA